MNNVNIKNIIDNYRFIKSLNLFDIHELDILLFGEHIFNEEDIVDIITKSIEEDEVLPEYSHILDTTDKLLLRDQFTYLSINGIEEEKLRLFNNDLLDNLKIVDEENNFNDYDLIYPTYNKLLKDNKYKDYFYGISNKLFKLLNSINNAYYEKISNLDKDVINFIDNLDTIKNWNQLDKISRKNNLVNEIIGRLLYSSVEYASNKYSNLISKEEFIKRDDFYSTLRNLKLTNKLLELSYNIDKNNEIVINKVIELYPYSVEIFDKKYISIAEDYGYKFNTKLVNCSYYIFNNLYIELIPMKDRYNYLTNLNNVFNNYKNTNNKDYLYKYLLGLDTYIRNINYYDPDINTFNTKSLEIFSNYKKIDTIKYLSELIKKYYDSSLNTTIGNLVIELLPISPLNIKINEYEELNTLRDMYIDLYDNYEIDIYELNKIINNKSSLYNEINNFYQNNELIIVTDSLINSNKLDALFNDLISITNLNIDKDSIKDKYYSNSSNLLIMLKKICDTSDTVRNYFNIYFLQREVMELIKNV